MIDIRNPYDNTLLQQLPLHTSADVEQALRVAHSLFDDQRNWLPAHKRIAILERTVEIMNSQVEELTLLAASEGGKPYTDSKTEVLRAINGVKLAIEHVPHNIGQQIPMGHTESSENRLAFTQREPIGVVVSVSAFNHPLNLIIHQTVPAIAVGCPVIIKPSLTTPLSCLRFVEILTEACLPIGWCQVLLTEREDSQNLVTDERVNFFSFIGSAPVGWMLRSKLSPGTRCALEHGGAAPVIVDKTANISDVVESILKGGFYHAGQVCVSVQRVFVPINMVEELSNKLADAANKLKVGDPLDPDTDVGPLILPREVDRVSSWVEEAKSNGAKILCGGEKISDTCYPPYCDSKPWRMRFSIES